MPLIGSAKLFDAACQWMLDRNWHQLIGKLGSYAQSLYDHTAAQINFLLALRTLLCSSYGLNLNEDQFLVVFTGALCHDAGKENPDWQRALRRGTPLPHHVNEEKTREVAADWAQRIGLAQRADFMSAVVAVIALHHKATQGVASTLDLLLNVGQTDPRWRELADLVEATDKIISTPDVSAASSIAEKWFGKGVPRPVFAVTFHRVRHLRGVSTTFVHKACQEAHLEAGWTPSLHFADGTLYLSPTGAASIVSEHDVRSKLVPLFTRLLSESDLPEQVVGNLHGRAPLPKPELFDPGQFSAYLKKAASRSKPSNFREKHRKADGSFSDEFRKYMDKYADLRRTALGNDSGVLFERFVMAVPLDSMLRLFNALIRGDKVISEENWPLDDKQLTAIERAIAKKKGDGEQEAIAREKEAARVRRKAKEDWLEKVRVKYDDTFGENSFASLKAVTNDPAINLAKAVDFFLDQEVPLNESPGIKWSSKPPQEQETELLARLGEIFTVVVAGLPQGALRPALDGDGLAEIFLEDVQLQGHAHQIDIEAQYESYLSAKQGQQNGAFCPFTNEAAQAAFGTGFDLGVATDGHSNRLPMQGNTWKTWSRGVPMATASRYELMLRRLILGQPTEQLIVLVPPAQLGPFEGARLVDQVRRLEEEISLYSGNLTPDPVRRFSFSLTDQIAGNLVSQPAASLTDLLHYTSAAQKTQGYKRDLEKSLREYFSHDIASLNEESGTSFADWTEAVDELFAGRSAQAQLALQNSEEIRMCRRQSLKLSAPGRLVCQTPNMILALLPNAISLNKESEVNAAIRQLLLSLVLNRHLRMSVAIIPPDEALTFSGCEGSVLVPRNPALRAEVARVRRSQAAGGDPPGVAPTHEWLLPHETLPWLQALAALHELGRERPKRSAGKAHNVSVFPQGSAFYDILSARSAGFVLKRMEDKLARPLKVHEMRQLEILQPFLG